MNTVAERGSEQAGVLPGARNQDHELIHELGKRLDVLWHYCDSLAEAEGNPQMQQTLLELKRQEQENIRRLKHVIESRIENGEFLEDL